MGNCCSAREDNSLKLQKEDYIKFIDEIIDILNSLLEKLYLTLKYNETIQASQIFFNGILIYFLDIKRFIEIEIESQSLPGGEFAQSLLEGFKKINNEIVIDDPSLLSSEMNNIEVSFKRLISKIENIFKLKNVPSLNGDFRLGYSNILKGLSLKIVPEKEKIAKILNGIKNLFLL